MTVFYHLIKKVFMKTKTDAKKRIMYIQGEDYNYLCYNLMIILSFYDCYSENKCFKDFRKIAYLIDFISNEKKYTEYSEGELTSIYSRAQVRKKLISHLLIVLKNKGLIDIGINHTHKTFNIWLVDSSELGLFVKNKKFEEEYRNLANFKRDVAGIKTATIKTMVDKIFKSKGVFTWEI
jgi:hypothetical protein